MSHLQLYQHILRETDAQFAFVFEDDAVIEQPGLLAALVEAKPFPGGWLGRGWVGAWAAEWLVAWARLAGRQPEGG